MYFYPRQKSCPSMGTQTLLPSSGSRCGRQRPRGRQLRAGTSIWVWAPRGYHTDKYLGVSCGGVTSNPLWPLTWMGTALDFQSRVLAPAQDAPLLSLPSPAGAALHLFANSSVPFDRTSPAIVQEFTIPTKTSAPPAAYGRGPRTVRPSSWGGQPGQEHLVSPLDRQRRARPFRGCNWNHDEQTWKKSCICIWDLLAI